MSEKQYVCTYENLEAMLDRVCIGDWDRSRLKSWAELWELPGDKKYLSRDDVERAMWRVGRDQYSQIEQGLDDLFGEG